MTKVQKITASVTAAALFLSISLGIVTAAPATVTGGSMAGLTQTDWASVNSTDVMQGQAPITANPAADSVAAGTVPVSPSVPVAAKPAAASPAPAKSHAAPTPVRTKPAPAPTLSLSRSTPATSSKANAVIATAKKYIGVKYQWGGTTPAGFDCSGFVQYVFAQNGVSLPRTSRDQFQVGPAVSFSSLKPGDLVFFSLDGDKVIDHDGIYIGNGQFINASTSKGVTIYTMGSYWQSHFIGAKRVL
ncbi:C40 family peptidase [Paradesulfitobacterium ferrireducens]|uniref:C40 family peptidase n=1 Tax=Paradesulfitobacterium ferrireducens TaxID=2816476 RepID=UPI001A8FE3B0|nr:C40 family peptidase [Paradesulfitobacterium ferrireducens]